MHVKCSVWVLTYVLFTWAVITEIKSRTQPQPQRLPYAPWSFSQSAGNRWSAFYDYRLYFLEFFYKPNHTLCLFYWLHSLCMIILRFIHAAARFSNLFLLMEQFSVVWMCRSSFTHSLIGGHLGAVLVFSRKRFLTGFCVDTCFNLSWVSIWEWNGWYMFTAIFPKWGPISHSHQHCMRVLVAPDSHQHCVVSL